MSLDLREAVAWRVKDFADGWILFHSKAEAEREAEGSGNLIEPLFSLPQLSDLTVRIAELEAGVSKIARGDVPPEKEGHYLAHREAVKIARALLQQSEVKG